MKPPLTPAQQALRLQGRHRIIGVATLMLFVVTLLPWLLAPARAPRAGPTLEVQSASFSGSLASAPVIPAQAPASLPGLALPTAPTAPTVPVPDAHPPQEASPAPQGSAALPRQPVPDAPPAPLAGTHPPQEASPAPQEPAPVVASAHVVLQVGVFSEQAKARSLLKKLEQQGIHGHMEVVRFKQGPRVRVRIGPLKTRSELKKLQQQLDQLGIKSMIVTP